MAQLHRNSLALRGVLVAREVVAVLERIAGNQTDGGIPVSYPRHLSTRTPSTESDSPPRHARAVSNGVNRGARRAGRPGGPAGVPVRVPARIAGRTIPLGRSTAVGVVMPAAWCLDQPVQPPALAGQRRYNQHSQALTRRSQPTGSLTSSPVRLWTGTCGKAAEAFTPAMRMPGASKRGK
jgi:hypothetical protein